MRIDCPFSIPIYDCGNGYRKRSDAACAARHKPSDQFQASFDQGPSASLEAGLLSSLVLPAGNGTVRKEGNIQRHQEGPEKEGHRNRPATGRLKQSSFSWSSLSWTGRAGVSLQSWGLTAGACRSNVARLQPLQLTPGANAHATQGHKKQQTMALHRKPTRTRQLPRLSPSFTRELCWRSWPLQGFANCVKTP